MVRNAGPKSGMWRGRRVAVAIACVILSSIVASWSIYAFAQRSALLSNAIAPISDATLLRNSVRLPEAPTHSARVALAKALSRQILSQRSGHLDAAETAFRESGFDVYDGSLGPRLIAHALAPGWFDPYWVQAIQVVGADRAAALHSSWSLSDLVQTLAGAANNGASAKQDVWSWLLALATDATTPGAEMRGLLLEDTGSGSLLNALKSRSDFALSGMQYLLMTLSARTDAMAIAVTDAKATANEPRSASAAISFASLNLSRQANRATVSPLDGCNIDQVPDAVWTGFAGAEGALFAKSVSGFAKSLTGSAGEALVSKFGAALGIFGLASDIAALAALWAGPDVTVSTDHKLERTHFSDQDGNSTKLLAEVSSRGFEGTETLNCLLRILSPTGLDSSLQGSGPIKKALTQLSVVAGPAKIEGQSKDARTDTTGAITATLTGLRQDQTVDERAKPIDKTVSVKVTVHPFTANDRSRLGAFVNGMVGDMLTQWSDKGLSKILGEAATEGTLAQLKGAVTTADTIVKLVSQFIDVSGLYNAVRQVHITDWQEEWPSSITFKVHGGDDVTGVADLTILAIRESVTCGPRDASSSIATCGYTIKPADIHGTLTRDYSDGCPLVTYFPPAEPGRSGGEIMLTRDDSNQIKLDFGILFQAPEPCNAGSEIPVDSGFLTTTFTAGATGLSYSATANGIGYTGSATLAY